jgi:DNA-binding NarL/FixJ family response regulator
VDQAVPQVGNKARLLLADQRKENAALVSHHISSQFEVIGTVYNGQAAVTATLGLKPEVLIVDIILPLLNGFEVIRRLVELEVKSKIIVLTAVEDPEYVSEALAAGANGYVFRRRIATDLPTALEEALVGRIFVSSKQTGSY